MPKSRKRQPITRPLATSQPEDDDLHRPIKPTTAPQSNLRSRIDRALPPFTVQRYVAIWALGMIPLIGLLLILLRPWDARPATPRANTTPTTLSGQGTPSTSATGTALPTAAPTIAPTAANITQPQGASTTLTETNKYLLIETPKGRIVARLHTATAPGGNIVRTIANFSERINSGVLDGSTFFRVEDWFVQGGGDPDAMSRLPAEYNKIPFTAGSVALAHGVDSAFNSDSQFLITKTDATQLNGQYTNLGQVIEGMDVVNKITPGDKMTKVRVEVRN
jgi:peptidyl-prolyl cis-trans isomerase B (cyclophilin B)